MSVAVPPVKLRLGVNIDHVATIRNARGTPWPDPLRAAQLAGKRVLLVDDVMTTGATLHAAAAPLRDAGALQVCALVLARTP